MCGCVYNMVLKALKLDTPHLIRNKTSLDVGIWEGDHIKIYMEAIQFVIEKLNLHTKFINLRLRQRNSTSHKTNASTVINLY